MDSQVNASIWYTLEEDSGGGLTLYINGKGAMPDFPGRDDQPWHSDADRICALVIGDGITEVGDNSFYGLSALERVTLPPSLRYIGTYSFRDCVKLREVTFPEGFSRVGSKAFRDDRELTKVSFPSTLRSIDIKSFAGCPSISDVSYAGSSWQWDHYIAVDRSFGANDVVLNADIQFGYTPDAAADFDDVPADHPCLDSIQLMYERSLMNGCGRRFFPDRPMTAKEVLDVLYLHAGADCLYRGSADWAGACLGLTVLPEAPATLLFVCRALFCLACYNGFEPGAAAAGEEPRWLEWAGKQGYLKKLFDTEGSVDPERALTRAQGACVLASYLTVPEAVSDRYEEMIASLRQVIAAGGDGRFHIAAINLNKRGMPAKAGDSTLLVLPQGSLMLIDCGYTGVSAKLVSFLRDAGVTSLDYLIFSHCHLDHTGGAPAVCSYIYEECGGVIRHFWYTGANPDKGNVAPVTEYLAARGVVREDILVDESGPAEAPVHRTADGVDITFFGPNSHDLEAADALYMDENANGTSLVMRFTFGSSIYLTAGDLYANKERYLLGTYGPEVFRATVAKANHHGNHTSSCQEWVDAVCPKITFSDTDGCGSYNVRRRFLEKGIPYYSTGFDGLIHLVMDDRGNYERKTQYDSNLRLKWPEESI